MADPFASKPSRLEVGKAIDIVIDLDQSEKAIIEALRKIVAFTRDLPVNRRGGASFNTDKKSSLTGYTEEAGNVSVEDERIENPEEIKIYKDEIRVGYHKIARPGTWSLIISHWQGAIWRDHGSIATHLNLNKALGQYLIYFNVDLEPVEFLELQYEEPKVYNLLFIKMMTIQVIGKHLIGANKGKVEKIDKLRAWAQMPKQ